MKRVYSFILCALALVVAFGTTSCDTNDGPHALPDAKEIVCSVGDRPTFTFTAGDDWRLSSDAPWCKFVTYDGDKQDMSGKAGTHTITLKITDEGIKNQPTFAKITIKIGTSSAVIATVERGPDKLYMRLYDVTDTPKTAIELGYVDWIPFRIEANFRFTATEIPYWIEIGYKQENGKIEVNNSITGVPGEQTEAYARIVNDGYRERSLITIADGHVIKFADESGANTFEFPVIYNGMGSDMIAFMGPTEQTYGWEVSLDGRTFRQTYSNNDVVVTYTEALDFTIIAQDDSYKVIRIDQNIQRGIPSYEIYKEEDSCWFNCTRDAEDQSLLTVTIDLSDVTRHGMIMVVPMAIWNKIRGDIGGYILDTDSSSGVELPIIHADYQQYVIMEFTQHDIFEQNPYRGMYVYHSLTALEILTTPYKNSTILEQYGVSEGMAYQCDFVNSIEGKNPGIIIDPRVENWTTENYEHGNASAEVWYMGEKLKISENEYYIGENKDEVLALHLWSPKEGFTDNVYVVFTVSGVAQKLLVVTPPVK